MANAGDRLKQKKENPKKSRRRRRKSLLVDVKRQHAKTNEKTGSLVRVCIQQSLDHSRRQMNKKKSAELTFFCMYNFFVGCPRLNFSDHLGYLGKSSNKT
jgi:hypothetical protein